MDDERVGEVICSLVQEMVENLMEHLDNILVEEITVVLKSEQVKDFILAFKREQLGVIL